MHIFTMELILEGTSVQHITEDEDLGPDIELDDVVAILIKICEVFELSGVVFFNVSGFGQEKWPVDCRTDLATIIEQIPEILENMRGGTFSFKLDFYEQGIERQLLFVEHNNLVKITCISHTSWIPNPNSLFMEKVEALTMVENLYNNFLEYSKVLSVHLAENPLLDGWKK